MAQNNRVDRINSEIKRIVGKVITEIKDPVVQGKVVSVIGVRTSADLSHTKVYITILGSDAQQEEVFLHIKKAEGFVQRRIAEELNIRKVPEVNICYDESIEQGERVLKILETLKGNTDESNA